MVYIASSESCEPKRFVRCWNKVERKYIQEQQPNQFHCYNQNMDFVSRMDCTWSSAGLYLNEKMVVVPACLKGSIKTTDHRPTDYRRIDPPTTYHLPTDPPTHRPLYPPTHRLTIIKIVYTENQIQNMLLTLILGIS